ncbi:hypothetical protein G7054_g14622 [Neopestalotiopsis clavispora]|nr:hypothetical protein G7054_g14622 [Neopestalotiopsis clavispora]
MKSVLVATAILAGVSFGQAASSTTATAFKTSATTPTTAAAEATSTDSSSSRSPTTTTVSVGLNHDFNPDSITAEVGDVIKFIFYPTNHSVVRAAYENPCIPFNYVNPGGDTFFSGPKESETGDEQPIWLLTVNNTDPTFFYCSAPGSCINSHMVGAINPNSTYSLAAQKAALADVKYQLSPGEPIPAEASSTGTGLGSTSTPVSSGSTEHHSSLSAGAIAGIAIGGAVVLIGAVALIWFCGRKGGIEKGYRKSAVANPPSASMMESNYNGMPKSPPPPMYRDSSYYAQSEAPHRSMSPNQWSQTGSPHLSYAGYPSPGLESRWSDVHGQPTEPPKAVSPGPVELMGNTHHPDQAAGRHEFPA